MFNRAIIAAAFMAAVPFSAAQVQVVDRQIPSSQSASTPKVDSNTNEMYYQLQTLQQEVLELRGLVEEQSHELKKLKQQRLDDYVDLDRRIGQMNSGGGAASVSPSVPEPDSVAAPSVLPVSATEEMKQYKAAMNLVIKEQKYDEAVSALKTYLDTYPNGRYAANAQYWMGEVYLKNNQLDQARNWFARVIEEHPQNSKIADAQYKLGIVYHKLGDAANAKKYLELVSQSDSNASRLAKEYLEKNFQ